MKKGLQQEGVGGQNNQSEGLGESLHGNMI